MDSIWHSITTLRGTNSPNKTVSHVSDFQHERPMVLSPWLFPLMLRFYDLQLQKTDVIYMPILLWAWRPWPNFLTRLIISSQWGHPFLSSLLAKLGNWPILQAPWVVELYLALTNIVLTSPAAQDAPATSIPTLQHPKHSTIILMSQSWSYIPYSYKCFQNRDLFWLLFKQ